MVASETASRAPVGASALLDQSTAEVFLEQRTEEVLMLLDPAPGQHSSTWHQMRMASVIRFLVPLALVACVAACTSRVVPLLTSTTSNHLRVIEEFDFKMGDSVVSYFQEGVDSMGAVSSDLAAQVDEVKRQAAAARKHMKEWTDHVVAKNQEQILDYVKDLSDAADELENAEADFVGLCDSAAQLLGAMGEELEKKIASAESTKISKDIKDEQDIMKGTIDYTTEKLENIKGRFEKSKSKFHSLAATSRFFSDSIEDDLEELESQKDNWETGIVAGYVTSAAICAGTGVATVASAGTAAPTLVFCGASAAAAGAAGIIEAQKDFEASVKRLKLCQSQFDDLEGQCDDLSSKAATDQKRLIQLQASVGTERVFMNIPSLPIWKNQVLPKNKHVVELLKKVVQDYQ